jgi:hypothetical protein
MDMIGHEAVGVHRAAVLCRQVPHMRKVNQVIGLDPEAGRTVYTPLNHVQRDTGKDKSHSPRHGLSTMRRPNRLTDCGPGPELGKRVVALTPN